MSIEIHQPELEAMIQQRMDSGAFQSVEDVLLQALKSLPAAKPNLADLSISTPVARSGLSTERDHRISGAHLVAAMQSSPAKEFSLEPDRTAMAVRDVMF